MHKDMKLGIIVIILCLVGYLAIDSMYAIFINDIPKTHNGCIIYVNHNYNKFYNYDWTDVEVLTYSGDSHHIRFWGHPEFKLSTNYRIHTKIKSRFYLFPVPAWQSKQLITKLEVIQDG